MLRPFLVRLPLVAVLLVVALLVVAPSGLYAQDGPLPILATDLLRIEQLDDVAVSPSGREVVYTVRTIVENPDEPGTYHYRTHLYLADAAGRTPPRALTRGPESASQPAWHPEGDRLAFVRQHEGMPQVFVLSLYGGEPYPVTDFEHGATSPTWSPAGDRLLFAARLPAEAVAELLGDPAPAWPDERPGRPSFDPEAEADPDGTLDEIRAWLQANRDDANPRVLNRLDLQGEFDLAPEDTYRHLFVADVAGDTLFPPVALTRGYDSFGGGTWVRGGTQVVYSGAPASDLHPDRVRDGDLYIVDADGENRRRLLDGGRYALSSPLASPDGQALAFGARDLGDAGYAQTELGLVSLDDPDEVRWLTDDFDRSVGAFDWSPDGWHLYFTAPSDGGFPLYRLQVFDVPDPDAYDPFARPDTVAADTGLVELDEPLLVEADEAPADTLLAGSDAGPQIERMTDFESGVRSFAVGRASIFYVLTRVENPYELYVTTTPFDTSRRLTRHNADWLESRRLSRPEAFTLVNDGREIDYWVMRPTFYEEGTSYPLLVEMHGGPSAMWGPGEATMWHEFQYFASRGYTIVYANPRGSGGYGYRFQRANFQDWGDGPASDVLAAAAAAAALPDVDADRQLLTGGSYAGYLTAWIVSQDDRFRAAAAQRGVYDLSVFMGEGNAWRLVPTHFGGYPWQDRLDETDDPLDLVPDPALAFETPPARDVPALLIDEVMVADEVMDEAAVLDSMEARGEWWDRFPYDAGEPRSVRQILDANSPLTFVEDITTPLLILHADQDLRTGVIQSEMLYKSLKVLGRPVEYVRYPNAGHDLSRTGDPKQRIDRILRMYEFFERFVD